MIEEYLPHKLADKKGFLPSLLHYSGLELGSRQTGNQDGCPRKITWPALTFSLHPSVQRLDFEWNIPEMWQALTADEPTPVDAMRETASPWLIWREQLITRFRSMPTDEQQALDTLGEGASFNDICEALASLMPEDDVPLRAAGLLKGWLAQGLISGFQ